ncbi:uncharacterized protein LOC126814803 [Patella vulgata]|uniref:uncharacterized protein LOC126814803 n=1 Tax=Patella vulgata TaxID=6465 RepID=UPI0024A9AD98|nr:uncharacterized protein LOC126814803 [Patella vulgata]
MKFMNNGENGIRKKLLLAQAEDVLLKLQLYTLSTRHLIALYITLTQKTDQPDYIKIEPAMSALLYKISSNLESKNKCFSGHVLVNWLIHHKSLIQKIDPVYNDGPFYREKAVDFCQKLLNLQILIDVDVDIEDRSITPSICSLEGVHYPGVTIFSQYQHSSSDFLTEEDENEDSDTPIPSPAKSPVSPADSNTPIGYSDTNFYVDVEINPVQSLSKLPEIVFDKNINDFTVTKHSTKAGKIESTVSTDNSATKEDLSISFSSIEKSGEKCQPIVDAYYHEFTNRCDKIKNPKVVPSTESSSRHTIKLPLLHSRNESECSSQRTSFTSTSSTGRVVQFCDKKNQFYRVAEAYVYGNHHFSMIDPNVFGDSFKGKIDLSETLSLAERCFLRKISPVTLLSILYIRRKQDTLAKSVIKQLPEHIVDEIKNYLDIPSNSCISS